MTTTPQYPNLSVVHSRFNRRILLIDDNRAIHEDFQKILGVGQNKNERLENLKSDLFKKTEASISLKATTSFDLSSAYQGQDGAQMVKQSLIDQNPYALAFVDMRMPPGWDGLETIVHLWKIDPELQVVINSAYSDYSWEEIVLKVGTTHNLLILKKPFDNVEVIQLAHAQTQKWTLNRQTQTAIETLEQKIVGRTQELQEANQHLEQEINQREQRRSEWQREKKLEPIGHLGAGIAHEINTPIQFIGDNTRFLQETFEEVQQLLEEHTNQMNDLGQNLEFTEFLEHIQAHFDEIDFQYLLEEVPRAIASSLDGIKRVSEMVCAMTEFSHPSAKNKKLTALNTLIKNTATICRNEWKYVADLTFELDENIPLVPCLPREFCQVVLNMIMNAAQAISTAKSTTGQKGLIALSTQVVNDTVELSIRDTGVGMTETIRDKIFNPFFTTKEKGKDSEQGLSTARALIVDKLGGTIHCDTVVGKGTTFSLALPIHQHQSPEKLHAETMADEKG